VAIKKKKGGINQGLILLSGLVFLVGAVLTYFFILQGVYGSFDAKELIPDTNVIKGILMNRQ
jgi:hypothetical protein